MKTLLTVITIYLAIGFIYALVCYIGSRKRGEGVAISDILTFTFLYGYYIIRAIIHMCQKK